MSAELLKEYKDATDNFIATAKNVPADTLHKAPSDDDWSPANIIHHLADTEAHFYIRYLKILTEDVPTTDFFDETVYPTLLKYEKRDVAQSLRLVQSLRESFYTIMCNFTPDEWEKKGRNSDVGEYPIIALIKKSRSHIKDHLQQLHEAVAKA
jgi:hypothetical protein